MKRYENIIEEGADGPFASMWPADDGEYVRYDEAAARIAALDEQLLKSKRECGEWFEAQRKTAEELRAARTELAQLREGIALRAKGQVGPDALVKELRTELAAARDVLRNADTVLEEWIGLLLANGLRHSVVDGEAVRVEIDSQLAAEKGAT